MSKFTLNFINSFGLYTGFILLNFGGFLLLPDADPVKAAFSPFCLTLGTLGVVANLIHLWRRN